MISMIYGLHAVNAKLKSSPDSIVEALIQKGKHNPKVEDIIKQIRKKEITVEFADKKILDKKSDNGIHQGIILLCKPTNNLISEEEVIQIVKAKDNPLILVLDGITDPHNFGACLRTADSAGIDCVILAKDKSCPINATVSKVASGASESVSICYATNLARILEKLKEQGVWLCGLAGEAEQTIYQQDCTMPLAIIMGSEGKGLRQLTRKTCDFLVKLPMHGEVSSLNVSVATGISLYEVLRQRG